jgi:hypothetical protein
MSLFALRERLLERGPSTAPALAADLGTSAQSVEAMLAHWISRGKVEVVEGGCHTGGLCRTCGACALSRVVWYAWTEPSAEDAAGRELPVKGSRG